MYLNWWPLTDAEPGAAGKHGVLDLPTQQRSEFSVIILDSQWDSEPISAGG